MSSQELVHLIGNEKLVSMILFRNTVLWRDVSDVGSRLSKVLMTFD